MRLPTRDDLAGLLMVLALVVLLACVSAAHCADPASGLAVTADGKAVTETLYRPVGPNLEVPFSAKRAMGLWEPVPVTKTIAQLRAEWKLEQEQLRAQEDAAGRELLRWWFGVPLLSLGLVLMVFGGYLTIKGADLGTDAIIIGVLAAAPGLCLILYPRQAGWAGATVMGLLGIYAVWRAWGRAAAKGVAVKAEAAAADIVTSVDKVRAAVGDPLWSDRIRPILKGHQPATQAMISRIQSTPKRTG